MNRRAFLPAAVTALAATAAAPALLAEAGTLPSKQKAPRRNRRRGGLMHNPKFDALSFEGKRLVEYSRVFLRKLPKPGPGVVGQWLLAYDGLTPGQQQDLRQLLLYVEYMSEAELARYLDAKPGERMERPGLEAGLTRLAAERRIPFHTGAKVVVTAFGPWADRSLRTAPPDATLLPHAARDLLEAGTWYPQVTDVATTLPGLTQQVMRGGGRQPGAPADAVVARLRAAGVPREGVWAVTGADTNAAALGRGPEAPYLLSTQDAKAVDAYLEHTGFREKMRQARTPEEKRALRKEIQGLRDRAIADLNLADRYPEPETLRFVGHVMFAERGIKDRGNTFVHVAGLRTMQLLHPKFLYVQFGGPDEALRTRKRGRTFGEQGALGQGNYTDADYLMDMDQWSYYHWLEARQHPHYQDDTTFVLLFGPQEGGTTQAIVTGPNAARGERQEAATALDTLIGEALIRLV